MRLLNVCSRADSHLQKREILLKKVLSEGWALKVIAMELNSLNVCDRYFEEFITVIKTKRNKISFFQDLFFILLLAKEIVKFKPDMLFAVTIKPSIYTALLGRLFNKKSVVMITGLGYSFNGRSSTRKILRRLVVFLCKLSFGKNCLLIFQNNHNLQLFRRLGIGQNFVLVPGDGVNLVTQSIVPFQARVKLGSKFICVARVIGEKGLRDLRDASNIIRKKLQDFTVHLYGALETGLDSISKEELAQWEAEGSITYHGFCSDLNKIYAEAYCFVLPSYHEGLCTAVLEAMSYGVPIIGTNIAGIREVVIGNGILVPPKNINILADSMQEFIFLEQSVWEKMSAISLQRVASQHSRENLMSELYQAINLFHTSRRF
jgi:glycosyltransferase involved in cell wall biosynthesis